MCEPLTIAAVTTMAAGAVQKAGAQSTAAGVNATIARSNANIDDMAAGDAIARGQLVAGRDLMTGAKVQGKQQSQLAASGVDTKSGSALTDAADAGGMSKLDSLMAESDAERAAWGYKTQANNLRYQASVDEAEGANDSTGTILGGISQIAQYGAKTISVG